MLSASLHQHEYKRSRNGIICYFGYVVVVLEAGVVMAIVLQHTPISAFSGIRQMVAAATTCTGKAVTREHGFGDIEDVGECFYEERVS